MDLHDVGADPAVARPRGQEVALPDQPAGGDSEGRGHQGDQNAREKVASHALWPQMPSSHDETGKHDHEQGNIEQRLMPYPTIGAEPAEQGP